MDVRRAWCDLEAAGKQKDVLRNEIHPVILILRASGVLPLQYSDGRYRFNVFSPIMAYSATIYTSSIILIWFTTFSPLGALMATHRYFDVFFFTFMATSYFLLVICIPVINWPETKRIVQYMNSWNNFQVEFYSVTGSNICLFLKRQSIILCVVIIVVGLFYELTYQVVQDVDIITINWWITVKEVFLDFVRFCLPLFWHLLFKALRNTSQQLFQFFQRDLASSYAPWTVVCSYRKLWFQHSQLVRGVGECFCYSIGFYILYMFLTLTMFLYHTMSNMSVGFRADMFLMCIECFLMGAVLFIICNDANHVTSNAGDTFVNFLLKLRSSDSRDIQTEVDLFLDTISRCFPEIRLKGYVVVNRSLFVSLGSMMVTYLIVLVQFNMSTDGEDIYNLILEI